MKILDVRFRSPWTSCLLHHLAQTVQHAYLMLPLSFLSVMHRAS